MSQFKCTKTPLNGLMQLERHSIEDSRGFFSRFFCKATYSEMGCATNIAQINHTLTRQRASIRGMHFQHPPYAETKIVSCLVGEIFDVAVDIRSNSPTFLQWHAVTLSAKNQMSLCIPPGFAHGFQTLVDDCQLFYLHSASYAPHAEGALNAMDPGLAIKWPLGVSEISARDQHHPLLDDTFVGVT